MFPSDRHIHDILCEVDISLPSDNDYIASVLP
jgi:hypothetical protein